ncbi:myo-inositol monophosphatase 1 [Capsaspora owczarzaki ATCC 30864]|uniref:Inositol-1-monophosphatase n=1 Tax=Capsaspora owczarzaki (strain ATCC 30864) TaxID=595528 RepID=A0A0D2VJT3_CAPO3|nr:myo-inositol monophosphatase 1 [Capsaspora owczarzaki ATCC 30864]KJE90262.1 myo-inositol monophosphatase 1 [Capsaspora owczarzaki ATCC 30864]|eukprot:XP_004364465.1 myo-inositol monophosphatase 1 [Capsaspora owczarzaki ATCC 30864]
MSTHPRDESDAAAAAPAAKRSRLESVDEFYETAVAVAREAGATIRAAFDKNKSVMLKSASTDLVTETDQKVEAFIINSFKDKFPSHKFIGEESVAAGIQCELTDDPTWIIDPLDGTTNFVHRFPFVAVSIALVIDKAPVIGIVYNCILDEMYTAVRGRGAFKNGVQITTSQQTAVNTALIGTEFGSNRKDEVLATILENMRSLAGEPNAAHSIRCLGSAALNLCAVASGAMDAYFEFGIHVWDIAAGILILQEANGVVRNPDGTELDIMARRILGACTPQLADEITSRIKNIVTPRD